MKYLTNLFLFVSILALITACQTKSTNEDTSDVPDTEEITASLEKVWETDTILNTAESVIFDKENNVLYVSCIGAVPPNAKDGDGFIAKVSPEDGSIIDMDWITDLDAPKGMGIQSGTLYVTNIDELVTIDIATGKITNRYPVENAEFLNDVTVDSDGNVYFSDSNTNLVHKFANGQITLWAETSGGPNGLFHDGEKMMVATFGAGTFNEIDTDSKKTTMVADSIPGGDGVVKTGADFLVSNWNGEVYYVNSANYESKKILDSKHIGDNAADIEFIPSTKILYVPTFFGNKVVAYKLTK